MSAFVVVGVLAFAMVVVASVTKRRPKTESKTEDDDCLF